MGDDQRHGPAAGGRGRRGLGRVLALAGAAIVLLMLAAGLALTHPGGTPAAVQAARPAPTPAPTVPELAAGDRLATALDAAVAAGQRVRDQRGQPARVVGIALRQLADVRAEVAAPGAVLPAGTPVWRVELVGDGPLICDSGSGRLTCGPQVLLVLDAADGHELGIPEPLQRTIATPVPGGTPIVVPGVVPSVPVNAALGTFEQLVARFSQGDKLPRITEAELLPLGETSERPSDLALSAPVWQVTLDHGAFDFSCPPGVGMWLPCFGTHATYLLDAASGRELEAQVGGWQPADRPAAIVDPALAALQTQVEFPLLVPTKLPAGLTADTSQPVIEHDPGFTRAVMSFHDAGGQRVLTITEGEADSAGMSDLVQTLPRPDEGGVVARLPGYLTRSATQLTVRFRYEATGVVLVSEGASGPVLTADELIALAGSLAPVAGAPAAHTATPSMFTVPLTSEADIWQTVLRQTEGSVDPILRPANLPPGFTTVQYRYSGAGGFQVEYDGPGKRLLIVVAGENAPPTRTAGSTRQQNTVRGRPATLQIDNPAQPSAAAWLWWSEPGHWQNVQAKSDHIAYLIRAEGVTPDELLGVARGMLPVE
ncbi:MAG TPA: hypothetical protein VFI42_07890 [Thermomicrobiaceae bacterium]|nr:hypothetical protein [Thermomicrobiaceae bacterium]